MESPYYGYYHMYTDSTPWDTQKIESYLLTTCDFANNSQGLFKHKTTFLCVQLMLVKEYHSGWSNENYNHIATNYIDIVTAKTLGTIETQFFREFEEFMGCRIVEETD